MINLKNFLKTVTVFSLMVTIVPDAKPMDLLYSAYEMAFGKQTPKFNASDLTELFTKQEYTALRPLFETYLAGAQNDAAFKLIQKVRFDTNDQYALYMDIFNFVDKRRRKCPVGPGEISFVLKSMVFQMLQLPGEIACCLARGDRNPELRTHVYELFRLTYAYWFATYLCQDKELFDAEETYEYSKVLEGALAYKKELDEKKVVAPHALWVRYCTADPKANYRIHFDTPSKDEHTGFETDEGIALDARERKQCWEEAVRTAQTCKSWDAFFKLKLESLIPVKLARLVKGDQKAPKRGLLMRAPDGAVDGLTGDLNNLSINGSRGNATAGAAKPGSLLQPVSDAQAPSQALLLQPGSTSDASAASLSQPQTADPGAQTSGGSNSGPQGHATGDDNKEAAKGGKEGDDKGTKKDKPAGTPGGAATGDDKKE